MSLQPFQCTYVSIEDCGTAILARFTRSQLSDEENIDEMGQELMSLIDHFQCRQLVLSLEIVEFITSAALSKLITLHRRMHRKEGRLILCDASGTVASVLHTSRLHDYFTMAPNAELALAMTKAL